MFICVRTESIWMGGGKARRACSGDHVSLNEAEENVWNTGNHNAWYPVRHSNGRTSLWETKALEKQLFLVYPKFLSNSETNNWGRGNLVRTMKKKRNIVCGNKYALLLPAETKRLIP